MKNRRLVFFVQLKSQYDIPYSRVWVSELVRRGEFPAPIKLSANRNAWFEDEILGFKSSRPRAVSMLGATDAA